MIYYAIRHKPTGFFLPQRNKKGQTHSEITNSEIKPPRLFMRKHLAERALKCWLLGDWKESYDYDMFNEVIGITPEPKSKNPPENRKAKEMEIIIMNLRPIIAFTKKDLE